MCIRDRLNIDDGGLCSLSEFGFIKDGHILGENKILFARIDASKMLKEIEEKNASQAPATVSYTHLFCTF